MTAYDYENQRWVTGEPARQVRRKQLEAEIAALEADTAEKYLRFIGYPHDKTVQQALTAVRLQLAGL